ncbi:MAG: hypothetical protein F6K18_08280 [Okeania sp. SIO2C2]|uniref:hypothetical protein n=1 Tax=Okeania sp. SIO2C2 TaxID=2607787 RepID=UPI0013BCFBDB|nr:hypothetical protein [Okeania sp. SIO2C2]NEP86829.1 hypothetical protein [Okeania sp. SIO2C2]
MLKKSFSRRQETGDRRQETGDRRQETGEMGMSEEVGLRIVRMIFLRNFCLKY